MTGKVAQNSWFVPSLIFVLAALIYSINLDRPPLPDELHHVLAAQNLIETGLPSIGDGQYWRGILHTWLVAVSYAAFGEGLTSARIPSVIAVALVVAGLFAWVRREAGSGAAWIATVLLGTSPFTVEIAQFCRFYSLQLIFFTGGVIAAYYALLGIGRRWRPPVLAATAVVLLGLATSLQETTLIGVAGLGLWVFGMALTAVAAGRPNHIARRNIVLAVAAVVALISLAFLLLWDKIAYALWRYQEVELFAASAANEFWFYHLRYLLFYPTLWPITGVIALVAVHRNPRLGWLAVAIFSVAFILTSFAAQKGTRYFAYAQPFLAVTWGVGIAAVVKPLANWLREIQAKVSATLALPAGVSDRTSAAFVGLALLTIVLMNPFWLRSATLIGNVALPMENPMTDWRAARAELAPWVRDADIMVTTEELGAIYFLGRSDVRFSPSKLHELPEDRRVEFGIDPRVGRPVISKPESLRQLVRCFNRGLIVGPIEHWGSAILINDEMQAIIQAEARPIPVPRKSHLYAWGWSREAAGAKPASCSSLEHFSGLHGGR